MLAAKFVMAIYTIPVIFVCVWPSEPWFYIWIAVQAPFVYMMERRRLNLTAKYGGGAVGRLEPLSLPLLFVGWFMVKPEQFIDNLADPIRFAGMIVAIMGITFFSMRLRHCEFSSRLMKEMVPVIIGVAVVSLLAKLAIDHGMGVDAVFVYVFLQSAFSSGVAMVVHGFDVLRGRDVATLRDMRIWRGAMFLGAIVTCGVSLRMMGVQLAENPAFVNGIIAMSPFWVVLFYRVFKHEDRGDVKSGLGVVVCGICLLLAVIV